MKPLSVSLLGCGNMGLILLRSLVSLPFIPPKKISVFDPDPAVRKKTGNLKVLFSESAAESVKDKAMIILAVKPQNVPALLSEIQGAVPPDSLVITIAAGISIRKVQSKLGQKHKVVRAMPNTPALIKKGMTVLAYSERVSTEEKAMVRRIFNRVGKTAVVDEERMNAVTALSGSGPAYVFAFTEALVAGGMSMGLSEPLAYRMVTQTIFGSIKMLIKMDLSPKEQIEKVTSPGGTTLAGLSMLEKKGFKDAVISAIEAATHRAEELGQKDS
ncbi:MAG: pyrroline-5-carboxylate reductase [Nitrospiria bacterium]